MGDAGECQTSNKKDYDDEDDEAPPAALDEGDIALLKTYGLGPYTTSIKNIEKEINEAKVGRIGNKAIREGLSILWWELRRVWRVLCFSFPP